MGVGGLGGAAAPPPMDRNGRQGRGAPPRQGQESPTRLGWYGVVLLQWWGVPARWWVCCVMDPKRHFGLELPKGGMMTEDDLVKRARDLYRRKITFRASDIPGVGEQRGADPDSWHCSRHELFEEAGVWLGAADQTPDAINALKARRHVWLDARGWKQVPDPPPRSGWFVIVLGAEDRVEAPLQEQFGERVWLSFRGTGRNLGRNYVDDFLRNQNHSRPEFADEEPEPRHDHADMLAVVNANLDHVNGTVNWNGFRTRRR